MIFNLNTNQEEKLFCKCMLQIFLCKRTAEIDYIYVNLL